MNREEFRRAIRPLSPAEEELKKSSKSRSMIHPAIPQHYVRNQDGYYFLTNQIMTQMQPEGECPAFSSAPHGSREQAAADHPLALLEDSAAQR